MVWNLDPVLLRLGGVEIRYYGVVFVLALLGGYHFWKWQIIRGGGTEEKAEEFLLPAALSVIVGARLGHMVFYEPARLVADPLSLIYVWQGGLASHGATVGLMVVLWWYARRKKMGLLEVADRFAFSSAWGAALVRLGNFLNSEIVGRPTDLPWGVKFPRYDAGLPIAEVPLRHPSQLYEFAMGLSVLAILLALDKKLGGEKRKTGMLASAFLTTYFLGRFLVEFVKAQQGLPESWPITMGQVLSVPFALVGVAGWILLSVGKPRGKSVR